MNKCLQLGYEHSFGGFYSPSTYASAEEIKQLVLLTVLVADFAGANRSFISLSDDTCCLYDNGGTGWHSKASGF
jgi:hypothetical protein